MIISLPLTHLLLYPLPQEFKWCVDHKACFLLWWRTAVLLSPGSDGWHLPTLLLNLCAFSSTSFSTQLSNTSKSRVTSSLTICPWSQSYDTSLGLLFSPLNNVPAGQRGGRIRGSAKEYCFLMLPSLLFVVGGLTAKAQGFAGAYLRCFSLQAFHSWSLCHKLTHTCAKHTHTQIIIK